MKLRSVVVFCGMILQPVVSGHASSGQIDTPTHPTSLKLQKGDDQLTPEELNRRALSAWSHEDVRQSEQYFRQAFDLERTIGSDSLAMVTTLNGLGDVTEKYGDVTKAEDYYRQALAIAQKLNPDSEDAANSLHGLGNVDYDLGNQHKAEDIYHRALDLRRI